MLNDNSTVVFQEKGPLQEKTCVRILQPLDDALHDHVDRMCQLGSFMAASSTNNKSECFRISMI